MKKIKLDTTKLQLKKESIVSLSGFEQGAILGGNATGPCSPPPGTGIGCSIDVTCTCTVPASNPCNSDTCPTDHTATCHC